MEMTHVDWLTVYGQGSVKKGAELLKILRDKVGVKSNENSYSGFGGGWFFEQFIDRGFRLSTNDDGEAKIELQGLFWTGAVENPFDEFLRIIFLVRQLEGIAWKLTRVDVATDIFGLDIKQAFSNPKSKRHKWDFAFNYSEHQTKNRSGEMIFTGYTVRRQRWSLTVYNKRIEVEDGNPHPIKKSYFDTLAVNDEPITRIELRIKSSEALSHVQGVLQTVCKETDFCEAILKHWGDYHRIKTSGGNDESRFSVLFRDFSKKQFKHDKKEKVAKLYEDFKEIKIRDMARDFIRQGLNDDKPLDEIVKIFNEQVEWLAEGGEIAKINELPPRQKPKGDPSGEPLG